MPANTAVGETGGGNEEEYFRAIGKALEINTELNNACLEIIARAWADSRAELTAAAEARVAA